MKCPNCSYNIPDGMHKCLCCGYTVKFLRVLSEQEQQNGHDDKDDTTGYKEINPDDVRMGQSSKQGGGSIFDSLFGDSSGGFGSFGSFGGSPFGGMFGGIFESFGSVIGDLFGGVFNDGLDGGDEDSYDEEDQYTYDALGYRIKKEPAETVVVTDVEQYDENGELKPKAGKKHKKPKKDS